MQKPNILMRLVNALVLRIGKVIHSSRDAYYQHKNRDKPKLLVFTDSRGYEVVRPWNRKSAYASYVGQLCKKYHVEHVICPEFSTTVVDFLYEYQTRINNGNQYDSVIAHVGVVDYSPRPVSMLKDMMAVKGHKIAALFSDSDFDFSSYHDEHFDSLYFDQPVKNFYSKEFLVDEVIPKLANINNLIMVGCSPVLSDWQGNYWRARPSNMNLILEYSALCHSALENFIDYSDWSVNEVKRFTIDNIHLSEAGFDETYSKISTQLDIFNL